MKVSAIPAQITTVEDRIAGNLNLSQLLLLSTSLFVSAIIFFLFPPVGRFALYKLVAAITLGSVCSVLAIRTSDKLVIDHIKLRANYELRPHIYAYRRQQLADIEISQTTKKLQPSLSKLSQPDIIKLSAVDRNSGQKLLASSKYKVAFYQKTGGLIVRISYSQ